jgi:hypothetical protein
MEELKIVPDKLAVEDKYVVDYSIDELIIVLTSKLLKIDI